MTLPAGTDAVRQSLASFRQEREADWKAFEALLARVEKRAPRALSEDELLSLPLLYRSALSSLSVARATSLDSALIAYLEALCLRGYFYLYGAHRSLRTRIGDFFLRDWPGAIRDLWREVWVSVGLTVVGAIAGYWLVASDKRWYDAIIAPGLAGGRNPDSSAEMLRSVLYGEGGVEGFSGVGAIWRFEVRRGRGSGWEDFAGAGEVDDVSQAGDALVQFERDGAGAEDVRRRAGGFLCDLPDPD